MAARGQVKVALAEHGGVVRTGDGDDGILSDGVARDVGGAHGGRDRFAQSQQVPLRAGLHAPWIKA